MNYIARKVGHDQFAQDIAGELGKGICHR